jgi:hypothetical protein
LLQVVPRKGFALLLAVALVLGFRVLALSFAAVLMLTWILFLAFLAALWPFSHPL